LSRFDISFDSSVVHNRLRV